jgi:hypothetical protein
VTRFFDASAIVGAYAQQANSAHIRRLLAAEHVAVSRLTEVEVVSAFARLARESAVSDDRRDDMTAAFLADLDGWVVVDMGTEVTARARRLLVHHALRAGDAIQLASALVLESRVAGALDAFVASDRRLLEAASREHLPVTEG